MRRMHYYTKIITVLIAAAVSIFLFGSSGFCKEAHIRFATCEWEPYYGSKLLNQGYVTEITREALKRAGYTMSIEFVPWKRALYDAKNGYYDAVLGLYYTDERTNWLTYSKSYDQVQLVFFAKKGRKITWNRLLDLKRYTFGVWQGYVYSDEFDNASFLKKEAVRSNDLNLKKLMEKRVDLVPASEKVFLHWVKSNYPDRLSNLIIVPKPLSEKKLYHGFTKKNVQHQKYAAAFNKGLAAIKADGTFDRILQKHGFKLQ